VSPRRLWSQVGNLGFRAGLAAATLHRRRLRDVTFIAVTGSCGKTTAKELIAAGLATERSGRKSPGYGNGLGVVAGTVLRTRSTDGYCVVEAAAGRPGAVERTARVLKPDIVAVTCIGQDHRSLFRTLEATAEEKRHLLRQAAPGATAVLNADDTNVIAMAENFHGRVVTFGCSPAATIRASNARSPWPERLSFDLDWEGGSVSVRTRLCGDHWLPSVLAALGVVYSTGIPLEPAIGALGAVDPMRRRMSPFMDRGIIYMWDDIKAPLWTMGSVLKFLAQARVRRRILVVGTLSDYSRSASKAYSSLASQALKVTEEVIFTGPQARHALKAAPDGAGGRLRAFATAAEAREHLDATACAGDLILLEGSFRADRLAELVPASAIPV
jgi:UDP-N-acetylmuramoyl-tripeptide--D-alanyl-D-alanine ligase